MQVSFLRALASFLFRLGETAEMSAVLHRLPEEWPQDVWSYFALATGDSLAIHGSKLLGQVAFTLVGSSMSIAFAVFTWYAYEVHFLRLKRFFDPSRGQQRVSGS